MGPLHECLEVTNLVQSVRPDCQHALSTAHGHGLSTGKEVKNREEILVLLEAILVPGEVALQPAGPLQVSVALLQPSLLDYLECTPG